MFWFFYLKDERENRLVKKGNAIIEQIESYKKANGMLPNSLLDVGITEDEGADAIYYSIQNSSKKNYMIWFGTSLGESKTYYSDNKKWEDFYREMKNK